MILSRNERLAVPVDTSTRSTKNSIFLPFTLHHKLSITRLYLAREDVMFKDIILRSAFGSCESFIIQVWRCAFFFRCKTMSILQFKKWKPHYSVQESLLQLPELQLPKLRRKLLCTYTSLVFVGRSKRCGCEDRFIFVNVLSFVIGSSHFGRPKRM